MPLINCQINLILTWSGNCAISSRTTANQRTKFAITDTNLCVPVVFLSTDDNAKLLQQLKSGFKCTINWNNYESKAAVQAQNQYLNYVFDPSLQGVKRLFVLSFENCVFRTMVRSASKKRYENIQKHSKDCNWS